jgi:hypothetical protein
MDLQEVRKLMRPERARQLLIENEVGFQKSGKKTWVVLRGQYELQKNRRKISSVHGWPRE